jgi:hypothetical protein
VRAARRLRSHALQHLLGCVEQALTVAAGGPQQQAAQQGCRLGLGAHNAGQLLQGFSTGSTPRKQALHLL